MKTISAVVNLVKALQDKPGFGWFPYTLFAVSGFSSATLLLKLPETNNVNLTETLEEAEEFYMSASSKKCPKGHLL